MGWAARAKKSNGHQTAAEMRKHGTLLADETDYFEGMWSFAYVVPNVGDDGRSPIVNTQPFGALIRCEVLATLVRPEGEDTLLANVRYRYCGDEDPMGRNDVKSFYCYSLQDGTTADQFADELTLRFRTFIPTTIYGTTSDFIPVRGNHEAFMTALLNTGVTFTRVR